VRGECNRSYSRVRIYRTTVYVEIVLGEDFRAFINCSSRSVKDSAQHVLRHAKCQVVSCELDCCLHALSIQESEIQDEPSSTFLTSIPVVPSNTFMGYVSVQPTFSFSTLIPAPQPCFLVDHCNQPSHNTFVTFDV
jgi:hypothetical protein